MVNFVDNYSFFGILLGFGFCLDAPFLFAFVNRKAGNCLPAFLVKTQFVSAYTPPKNLFNFFRKDFFSSFSVEVSKPVQSDFV